VPADAPRKHPSDGADERVGAQEEERGGVDPAPVMTVPAEEVLRALEAAVSDGEVGARAASAKSSPQSFRRWRGAGAA